MKLGTDRGIPADNGRYRPTVVGARNYRSVRECTTLQEVEDCLKDPRLVPLGALRAGRAGSQVVVAYFGERS